MKESAELFARIRAKDSRAHLKVLELAKRSNLSNCFIFEDDALIMENAWEFLAPAIHELEQLDWDLFYPGGTTVTPAYQISPHLAKATGVYSTQSYALNASLYDVVLNSWHLPKIYDVFLAEDIAPKYRCYLTIPLIIFQKPGFSDIEHREVDYKRMMERNYARDLVPGAEGKSGIWRLPTRRTPKRELSGIGK